MKVSSHRPFASLVVAAIIAGVFGKHRPRGAHSVTIFAVLLSFLCSCVVFDVLQGTRFNGPVYTWMTSGDAASRSAS